MAAVAAQEVELKNLGVQVIAVSTDSQFSHWMWKETSPTIKDVNFPLAADPSGAVSRSYGAWQSGSGLNRRARFIIDPEGIVQGVEVLAGPIGRNVDELIRQLKAMQAVRASEGMAAPAGWQPGDPLIKTGLDVIGKY